MTAMTAKRVDLRILSILVTAKLTAQAGPEPRKSDPWRNPLSGVLRIDSGLLNAAFRKFIYPSGR